MTELSLKRPITILMIAAGLSLLGAISWQRLAVQLLPQFIYPEIYVGAGMPGASPEKIEKDVVIPIEGEVATLEGIHDIESTIRSESAAIRVSFDFGTDMRFALLKLNQKMTQLQNQLPEAARIEVEQFDTADLGSYLMNLSIQGDVDLETLREVAERRVRERLEQVDGVVGVSIGGGDRITVGIVVDPDRCEAMNIPISAVGQKINAFHRQPEHLGRVIQAGKFIDVIIDGRMHSDDEIADLIIDPRGPIRVRDVAFVGRMQEERTQLYRVNGKAGVGLFIQKDNISNILEVNRDVLQEINTLNEEMAAEGYELVVNFSQAELIQETIDRIEGLALSGAVLALIILYLFLRNIRFVAILMVAIPVSLLITFNLMYGFNLSINVLSLCGLALAVGMLVDNGIVVMENIFLHRQQGKSAGDAARVGAREVGRSITAATVTTILVFLPVLFVESRAQLLVKELALSVVFPLLVSLAVALTVVPLLARRALTREVLHVRKHNRTLEIYRLFLKSAIRHPVRTVSAVGTLLLICLFIGSVFILTEAAPPPPSRLDLYLTMPRGFTLAASDEIVKRIETQANELSDIAEVRASIREEEAHVQIQFLEPRERTEELQLEKIKERIRRQNERLQEVELAFEQRGRGGVGGGGSGNDGLGGLLQTSQGLKLKGHDLNQLRQLSEQLVQTLSSMPDIERRAVQSDLRPGAPELQVRGDRLSLAMAGLDMQTIMAAIWASRMEGARTNTPMPGRNGDTDIQILSVDSDQRRLEDVEKMKVSNNAGQLVQLNQVASVRTDNGLSSITRHNQERQVQITYEFTREAQGAKNRLEQATAQIEALVQNMRLPKGFTLEKLETEEDQSVYYWMLAIGAILIYMFLAAQFESMLIPLAILGTVPTAIIGAIVALTLSGTPLSLGLGAPMALLGLIVLLGIVVNNGIILLDRIAILQNRHGYRWQRAVLVAGQSRVRPIMMTSATTCLGLLPLSLKQGVELELWPPFAITVLGGLLVSAVATLVFIPVMYVGLQRTRTWLKGIGWLGIALSTLAATALLYWYYQSYESVLWTCVLVLPLWFSLLGLVFGVKYFLTIKAEKARLATEELEITISNLTKVYGAPGRLKREWDKQSRRLRRMLAAGQRMSTREDLKESAIWLMASGILLGYLHTYFSSGFWIIVIGLITLVWAVAASNWWRRWQEVEPGSGKDGRTVAMSVSGVLNWMVKYLMPGWLVARLWRRKVRTNGREEQSRQASPGKGVVVLTLLFVVYVAVRVKTLGLMIPAVILTILSLLFKRTSIRIYLGSINPTEPEGRFKRVKRGYYALVQKIPGIRPPAKQVTALHGVDLTIGKGMFGLLGPNGAGKTTLMRILVGVLEENRGSIKVNGLNLNEHREAFHGMIGYLPQDFGLYENMTPVEYLNYHALTSGIFETEGRRQLIDRIIESVGLWERRDDKISTFSGGMKQRVGIAQTLLHLPQIIVVDEPTVGLDPRERIRFRNLLSELSKERIIVFSTHIVEDISSTCDDVAVLSKGKLIYRGSPSEMQRRVQGKVFEAIVPESELVAWQKKLRVIQHAQADGGIRLRFLSDQPVESLTSKPVEPSLEDAYVYLLASQSGNGRDTPLQEAQVR